MKIVLYTRPGCHLCDAAAAELAATGLTFESVDISKDSALESEYGTTIPVISVDGAIVFEGGMDPADIEILVGLHR